MKVRKLNSAIRAKVPGQARSGGEVNVWVEVDDLKVFRVTCPQGHAGDVRKGTLRSIRNQLRLSEEDLERFVKCTMTGNDYEEHVRKLISEDKA